MSKVVFITGSSSGIGEQTAYCFAKTGAKLALTYHTDEKGAQRVREQCLKLGASDVMLEKLELADDVCIRLTAENVINKYGKVAILINNAGILSQKPLAEKSFAEIREQIKTNLEGPIKLTQLCLPHIKESIVNIGS